MRVPLTRPFTGDEEKTALSEVIDSGWLTQGPRVTDFEKAVAERLGVRHAIATSNGTTALHLALLIHGVGEGDEVIVPSYTWIATPNVVRMVGGVPVFADIDVNTFNVTPEAIEPLITSRTKAIMPVHQFGLPADLDRIGRIANEHNLIIIEDAACAMGSAYRGRPLGSHGNTTCFSFHPRKAVTTGEGGMLVTDSDELAAGARMLLNHGASVSDLVKHQSGTVEALLAEEFDEVGYNYRLTNLQGALGTVQLKRLDGILEQRGMRAGKYTATFAEIPHIIPPTVPNYATPCWQSYAIRISPDAPVSRNEVAQRLLDAGVACRPAYMACHVQPVYRRLYPELQLPDTARALETVIILPLYPQMTDAEQEYVMDCVISAVAPSGSRSRLNNGPLDYEAQLTEDIEQEANAFPNREEMIIHRRDDLTTTDDALTESQNPLGNLERKLALLTAELSSKTDELNRIKRTTGWKLFSRYGQFKYRRLLPMYRVLGLPPYRRKIEMPEGNAEASSRASIEDLPIFLDSNACDIICFPNIDGDSPSQRLQQLMARFADHGHRVFYIKQTFHQDDSPYFIQEKRDHVYEVSLRSVNRDFDRDVIDEEAGALFFNSINELRRDLHLGATASLVQMPFWWPLVEETRARFAWPIVYDSMETNNREKLYELLSTAVRESFVKASIVIVTYNNRDLSQLCLQSVYARTEWPNFEVIVVDNNSTDGTLEYLKEAEKTYPNLKIILNDSNLGFAAANTLACGKPAGIIWCF